MLEVILKRMDSLSKLDNTSNTDARRLDELSSAINRFQPAGLVERIQAIAQNVSNMAIRVEQILQNSMVQGRGFENAVHCFFSAVRDGTSSQCEVPRDPRFPECPGKVDWMRARWTSDPCYAFYGVDGSDCSFLIYLSEVEWFCPPLAWRNHSSPPIQHAQQAKAPKRQAAFRTDLSVLLDQVGTGKESLSFMKRRIRRLAQQWATAANRLDAKLEQRWRDQKKVRGRGLKRLFLLTVIRCHIRVIDTFGTEPAYNHEEYATLHGYRTNWGYWNLNARQYMTMFPHTPDNSFMGFVSEELNETEKRSIQQNKVNSMAVVYGKEASMWKLFIGFGFPYEGPAPLEAIANGCIFLQPKFHPPHSSLNHEFFRGKPTSREVSSQHPYAEQYIGRPHVMTVDYNNSLEFDSAIREIMRTKVEPYLPYEYTCEGMLERVHSYIQHQDFCAPESPFIPANLSRQGSSSGSRITGPLFVPLPNSTALGWASNVTAPPAWPPLSSLRLLVSQEGQSCVEACHSASFICEPAHFRFINNKDALHGLEVQCEVVDSEINHILPAFSVRLPPRPGGAVQRLSIMTGHMKDRRRRIRRRMTRGEKGTQRPEQCFLWFFNDANILLKWRRRRDPAPLVMWSDPRWAFHIKVEWACFLFALDVLLFASSSLGINLPQCAKTEDYKIPQDEGGKKKEREEKKEARDEGKTGVQRRTAGCSEFAFSSLKIPVINVNTERKTLQCDHEQTTQMVDNNVTTH
ncbi:Alpha-1,6-mannosylglycoprotein 6-beta-N-acetylglucosaminyltransferase B [Collichthys lucidus]|uniref:alpha-1,6-mannosyl-glycoprotein 6-beta-N-acetylglucosaminyltransferase n=1 Tax=Collichthys lucidus TaxID=240159 RepID=A0A4U5U3W2_COLLU|nr:Alpha-1,6-mannosylglycoprotein 6-beta-N-acetylglucosaminyltransferase B [Collichthys lucidus]